MPSEPLLPRVLLLQLLLDAYERGSGFAKLERWPRDVIMRLDPKTFPDAFLPDARERLESLKAAAEQLVADGAARCERDRGLAGTGIKVLRMGPSELARAYACAQPLGYVPLARVLGQLMQTISALSVQSQTSFMQQFLAGLAAGVEAGDLSLLGMRRERLKRELEEVKDAMRAACAIARGEVGWERMISERLFRDSKRLMAIRARVIDILLRADPRFCDANVDESSDVLAVYGMRRRPGYIQCAGAGTLRLAHGNVVLQAFEPCAMLPEAWTQAWVEAVARGPTRVLTTIENEYPFYAYVEEAGGPSGLSDRAELAVYLGGFPARFLADALSRLARAAPALSFRHWGDADVGGIRIWLHLRGLVGRSVDWYRTTASWFSALEIETTTALSELERSRLVAARESVQRLVDADAEDAVAVLALLDAMLVRNVKVEQERV